MAKIVVSYSSKSVEAIQHTSAEVWQTTSILLWSGLLAIIVGFCG